MIQPEADQLELALRLATQLAETLAKLEQSPNLTSESRRTVHYDAVKVHYIAFPLKGPYALTAILERAREQSSGQI